jgi:hypothetical protein
VSLDFLYPVSITRDRKVLCKEITNKHLITIQKYIETNDNELLSNHFENLIHDVSVNYQNLNLLDKFLILINIRKNCLGNSIDVLSSDGTKNSISLTYVSDNILNNYKHKKVTENFNKIKLTCTFPVKISHYDNFYDNISIVEIDNEKIFLGDLKSNISEEILENVPFELIKKVKRKANLLKQKTINLFEIINDKKPVSYPFNFKSSEIFELLKLSFTNNLKNLYYNQFVMSSKLNVPPSDYNSMTPGESKILIKHLIDELEKQNKKSDQGAPPPGLGQTPQ